MRKSSTPIEPIRKRRELPLTPQDAFRLFTERMGEWWPFLTHSLTRHDARSVRFEGWVGGRVVEIAEDGTEHAWADVLAWDPPERVLLAWHPNAEPVVSSLLEIVFEAAEHGSTLLLDHRGWEEFGAEDGGELRERYVGGWDIVLAPFVEGAAAG